MSFRDFVDPACETLNLFIAYGLLDETKAAGRSPLRRVIIDIGEVQNGCAGERQRRTIEFLISPI